MRTLEKELNEKPLCYHYYIGYGGRQIVIGLVLGKKFQTGDFDSLKDTYQEYIINGEDGEEFKQKMQRYFDRVVGFLEQNDIDKIIE